MGKMREFEQRQLRTEVKIDTQKFEEIPASRTGTGQNFDLLNYLIVTEVVMAISVCL